MARAASARRSASLHVHADLLSYLVSQLVTTSGSKQGRMSAKANFAPGSPHPAGPASLPNSCCLVCAGVQAGHLKPSFSSRCRSRFRHRPRMKPIEPVASFKLFGDFLVGTRRVFKEEQVRSSDCIEEEERRSRRAAFARVATGRAFLRAVLQLRLRAVPRSLPGHPPDSSAVSSMRRHL